MWFICVDNAKFVRKLQEKLAQFKARKLEHQREMSISTILTVGDYQERYIM